MHAIILSIIDFHKKYRKLNKENYISINSDYIELSMYDWDGYIHECHFDFWISKKPTEKQIREVWEFIQLIDMNHHQNIPVEYIKNGKIFVRKSFITDNQEDDNFFVEYK